jgi:hypothetical protein
MPTVYSIPIVTTKNASRYYQISLGGKITPGTMTLENGTGLNEKVPSISNTSFTEPLVLQAILDLV